MLERIQGTPTADLLYYGFHVLGFVCIFLFNAWYGKKREIPIWKSTVTTVLVYGITYIWIYVLFWIESGFTNFGGNNIVISKQEKEDEEAKAKAFIAEIYAMNERMGIPKGFAHGFLSLEDNTIVNYAQTTGYNQEHDCGIDALSIGYDWGVNNPIRSGRDVTFPNLSEFVSPF